MTKKKNTKTVEAKEKVLTAEQLVELSILDREIEFAKEAIRPKFELVVARKQELAEATEKYNVAHFNYSKAYKEVLELEAKANKIAN